MSLSDILALVFGATTLLTTFGACFMWVGSQKTKQITQDARIAALEAKVEGHTEQALLLTELRAEVKHLADAFNKQPALIAQVIAVAMRETLRHTQGAHA